MLKRWMEIGSLYFCDKWYWIGIEWVIIDVIMVIGFVYVLVKLFVVFVIVLFSLFLGVKRFLILGFMKLL